MLVDVALEQIRAQHVELEAQRRRIAALVEENRRYVRAQVSRAEEAA